MVSSFISFSLLSFSFILFLLWLKSYHFLVLVPLYDFFTSFFNSFFLSFNFVYISLIFLTMVTLVSSLIFMFGKYYMSFYNFNKFFFLTISFFFSMAFLSVSGSFMSLALGWDMLGVSSLFLIMFYPNKTGVFNSYLTMFFNRVGDVCMIFIFCHFLFSSSLSFNPSFLFSDLSMFLFLCCAMTKSAQFPMSSWLPAAMSAPTPISAMVHSSTLVTAGIFILISFFDSYLCWNFFEFFSNIFLMTFLLGGMLGCLDLDVKKIVAFSTMSQISMILFLVSLGFSLLGLGHMFIHAFFKTMLFCSVGFLFSSFFSDQSLFHFFIKKSPSHIFSVCFFSSIFCMSGLTFSSSFFSKDVSMELIFLNFSSFWFFFLLLGSLFTILYSCKITLPIIFSGSLKSSFSFKSFNLISVSFFALMIFSGFLMNFLISFNFSPVLSGSESFLILFILLFFLNFLLFFSPKVLGKGAGLGQSKFFSFTLLSSILAPKFFKSFILSDSMFLSPSNMISPKFFSFSSFMFNSSFLVFMFFIMFFYFYLFSFWNAALKMLKI